MQCFRDLKHPLHSMVEFVAGSLRASPPSDPSQPGAVSALENHHEEKQKWTAARES